MKKVRFFYDTTTQDILVSDDTPVLISKVDQLKSKRDGRQLVKEAMEHPIGSPRLKELAREKRLCDHY